MTSPFDAIPDVKIDYGRAVFGAANEKVSTTMSLHPSIAKKAGADAVSSMIKT